MKIPNSFSVTILPRHISEGRQCSPGSCPLALALRDKFGLTEYQVRVGYDAPMYISGVYFDPTEESKEFIDAADHSHRSAYPTTLTFSRPFEEQHPTEGGEE